MELKRVKWGSDETLARKFETISKEESHKSNPLIAAHDAIIEVMRENSAIKDTLFKAMDDILAHKINSEDARKICKDAEKKLKVVEKELQRLIK